VNAYPDGVSQWLYFHFGVIVGLSLIGKEAVTLTDEVQMSIMSTPVPGAPCLSINDLSTQKDAELQSQTVAPCACGQGIAPSVKAGTSAHSLPHSARLLVVEDHTDTARVMSHLLKKLGYEIQIAPDVKTALELAAATHFDLVISDLGLPDGSGLDLMKELRARHDLKGIAVTGYGMPQDIEESRAAGFVAHLLKPFDLPKLEETLRHLAM
jgi:CheY-like chemotaxis protein